MKKSVPFFPALILFFSLILSISASALFVFEADAETDSFIALSELLSDPDKADSIRLSSDIVFESETSGGFSPVRIIGKKTLDLNGCVLSVSDSAFSSETLFVLENGSSLTILDTVGTGGIRFDRGSVLQTVPVLPDTELSVMRNVFEAKEGAKLSVFGGRIEAGNEVQAWADTFCLAEGKQFAGVSSFLTGGSAVTLHSGAELCLGGGTVIGYGFSSVRLGALEDDATSSVSFARSASVRLEDGARAVILDGILEGRAGADVLQCAENAALQVFGGEFMTSSPKQVYVGKRPDTQDDPAGWGFSVSGGVIGIPKSSIDTEYTKLIQDEKEDYEPNCGEHTVLLPIPSGIEILADGEKTDSLVYDERTDCVLSVVPPSVCRYGEEHKDLPSVYTAEYGWYLSGKGENVILLLKTSDPEVKLSELLKNTSLGFSDHTSVFCVVTVHGLSAHAFSVSSYSDSLSLSLCPHEWELRSAVPSCSGHGPSYYRCLLCGIGMTKTVTDPEGHLFVPDAEGGCGSRRCVSCGKIEEGSGHVWETVGTETFCTEKIVTSRCRICGIEEYSATKRSSSHKFGAYTDVDGTYHSRTCSVCGFVERTLHKTSGGVQKCTVCSLLTSGSFPSECPIALTGTFSVGSTVAPDGKESVDWICRSASVCAVKYEWFVSENENGEEAQSCGKGRTLVLRPSFAGKYVFLTAEGTYRGTTVRAVSAPVPVSDVNREEWQSDAFCHFHSDGVSDRRFDPAAHIPGEWITVKDATCTESGLRRLSCSVCGMCLTEERILAGHRFDAWKGDAPECGKTGYIRHVCTICGKAEGLLIPECGHYLRLNESVPADCMVHGNIAHYSCVLCETAFSFEDPSQIITYTDLPRDFLAHMDCRRGVNALEHYYECRCGERTRVEAHTYPEDDEICSVCGYLKGSIPETENPYYDPIEPDDTETETLPVTESGITSSDSVKQTGNLPEKPGNPWTDWFAFAVSAGTVLLVCAVLAGIVLIRKKKANK